MTPNDFFDKLEKEQHNMMRWVGELYLELHNGTYTSQVSIGILYIMFNVSKYAQNFV